MLKVPRHGHTTGVRKGRLCRVVESATGSTDLQALADPCATATQTAGTATTNVSTRYTYDGAGNLASMIDAAGHTLDG